MLEMIGELFNYESKNDDTEFEILVATTNLACGILSEINIMLLQIMNHDKIDTKFEKLNSLVFRDINDISLFMEAVHETFCLEIDDALYNHTRASSNYIRPDNEDMFRLVCKKALSTSHFIQEYIVMVNTDPNNLGFSSLVSFTSTIYYMTKYLLESFYKGEI